MANWLYKSICLETIALIQNNFSALTLADMDIEDINLSFFIVLKITSAKSFGSPGSTKTPVIPSSIESLHPGLFVVIIPRPVAAASHRTFGNPSG